ncbi:MAG: Hpt domain-containing protein [Candidatus Kapaibacteriales bacterium]
MKLSNDPFVLELLPEFVDNWLADLKKLPDIISSQNADELYRFAHTLKGSCFQFGLDHIAHMGIELMGYAKSYDWVNASSMEEKIKNSFLEVKTYLENNLNK